MVKNKIHIKTLGCPKNLVDSDKIFQKLRESGYVYTPEASEADAIIVNTCGFIDEAKKESVETLFNLSEEKDKNPDLKLIAVGCLTERYPSEFQKEMKDEVDAFLGVEPQNEVVSLVESLGLKGDEKQKGCLKYESLGYRHSNYIKISEGCSNGCAFCAIPLMKGYFSHRRREDVLADFDQMLKAGVKEVNIVAQDTTAYGKGLYRNYYLHDLLEEMGSRKEIEWIRLLYAYPTNLKDEVIELLSSHPKICRYIDIPLQHINTEVLKKMRRRMDRPFIEGVIEKLKNKGIAIRTTFIVGFPGETDEHFQELLDFLREFQFDRVGVFAYSHEEGTRAYEMEDNVSEELKKQRVEEAMKVQQEVSIKKNRGLLGQEVKVLVEGRHPLDENYFLGRTEKDAPDIDNSVYLPYSQSIQSGQFVQAKIVETFPYDIKVDYLPS